MHVWIFVFSTMFSPVVEPLGLSIDATSSEPIPVGPMIETGIETGLEEPMRYHGIEQLLAKLEAEAAAETTAP